MPRRASWKRAFLLAPVLLGLFLVTLVDPGHLAYARVEGAFAQALRDPLSLFSDRSPGERTGGVLRSTKGPRERVLPVVRERDPAGDAAAVPPVADPVLAGLPDGGVVPMGPGIEMFPPTFYYPADGDGPNPPGPPDPPDPPDPPVVPVPEPATWFVMLFGLLAMGGVVRRAGAGQTLNTANGTCAAR